MTTYTKEVYSEVFSVLNLLGEEYIRKIPSDTIENIIKEKDDNYNPKYDLSIGLDKQNIQKESLTMLAAFHLRHWCESEEEKVKLERLFMANEEKKQARLRQKYNPSDIFKRVQIKNEEVAIEETDVIKYEESIFKRILKKIKCLFN